jgi:hypothetical protein
LTRAARAAYIRRSRAATGATRDIYRKVSVSVTRGRLMTPAPEPACPVCGGPNDCAPARTGDFASPCWCANVAADPDVLAALPDAARNRACLCRRCLTAQPAPAARTDGTA